MKRLPFNLFLVGSSLGPVQARENSFLFGKPAWGVPLYSMPDYRGSDEYRWYFLPFPYVVYRGDILKIDRERISGLLFKTNRLQLDMSFDGAAPVDSSKNKARQGMPNLDPTFEIGPSLQVMLAENKTLEYKITLTFPIRAVFSTDFYGLRHTGWNFTPRLNIDQYNIGGKGWDFGMSFGPIFGDQTYHNYYYQVDKAFATPKRRLIRAQGGYGGMQCALFLGKQFKKTVLGLFVRAEDLHGTAFSESPLLKTNFSVMGGLYFSWIFMESKTLVEADK